jgi:predicted dehydrogenase
MAFGIAVIGLDHWYTAFGVLDIAAASETVTLVGVADPDPARLAGLSDKYPNAALTPDYHELLARSDVALVAICAPTDQAPAIARAALAAGKHVVSVKPPARTLAELDEVLALARSTRLFYGSFEGMQRLHPKSQRLRELIADGAIGQPVTYHQVGHGGLPSPWPGQPSGADSWWIRAAQVPGGAWLDHAIYAVDLARYIFDGEIELATVSGLTDQLVHKSLGMEDYGAALMRLKSRGESAASVTLFIEDTWAANGAKGGGAHSLDIIGTEGILRFDGKTNAWIVSKTNADSVSHPVAASPFFVLDALADVVAAHGRGESTPFGAGDARANLEACLRFYETAK